MRSARLTVTEMRQRAEWFDPPESTWWQIAAEVCDRLEALLVAVQLEPVGPENPTVVPGAPPTRAHPGPCPPEAPAPQSTHRTEEA